MFDNTTLLVARKTVRDSVLGLRRYNHGTTRLQILHGLGRMDARSERGKVIVYKHISVYIAVGLLGKPVSANPVQH